MRTKKQRGPIGRIIRIRPVESDRKKKDLKVRSGLIEAHGGYRNLKFYQMSE